jgi:dihydroxyacetone kinase
MTYLFNDPVDFAEESRAGFVAANARWVRAVTGGVVRADPPADGQVAVVIGGGTGHYPAFAGLVGEGLATGAVMGNLFASPSARQVLSVSRAAQSGAGVLLSYGNYAGDVLNFDQAQEQLREEGISCQTVVVTDDVSSASASEVSKRRGIAGGFVVFKLAGAAAAAGLDLDAVCRVASRANAQTRSLGVAFSGCTFPGASEPLFTVPDGTMAVGMGIHGEPGIRDSSMPSANELGDLFVDGLLAEAPVSGHDGRVALILNGLGSVKYEELFVVYNHIASRLREHDVIVVEPEVGEFVTSFEMAGASLTLCWLDDELEGYWSAAASTPAYRKGTVRGPRASSARGGSLPTVVEEHPRVAEASDVSRTAAARVVRALDAAKACIDEHANELGRLDSVAGDGDHGIGMQRGLNSATSAAQSAADEGAGAGTVLRVAGDEWADRGGGTSGALWGLGLRALGDVIGDTERPDTVTLLAGMRAARSQIEKFGRGRPGDKTMLDALAPFIDKVAEGLEAGDDASAVWAAAAVAATAGAEATRDLLPNVGRARPHAEKSLGTPDPGAISLALIVSTVIEELIEHA